MSIFKACDIRGVYGSDLSDAVARRIGQAIGRLLGDGPVLLAGDGRISTPSLKAAVASGVADSGSDVADAGIMPTPAFHHACRAEAAPVGAMVTASHNPARYNGLKVSVAGAPIPAADIAAMEGIVRGDAPPLAQPRGSVTHVSGCLHRYEADRARQAQHLAGMRVVVDGGNGVMGPVACRVLHSVGAVIEPVYCDVDGSFPNRSPNPADPGALAVLSQRVVECSADLGVAFDGDGDRALFVDNLGRPVPADVAIVLLARQALAGDQHRAVVYDQKCSSIVPEGVKAAGGIPVMERSGYAFMRVAMETAQAVYGGELSGHHFFGDIGYDDGLLAAIRMAGLVRASGRAAAALIDQIPRYAITPDIRVHVQPGQASRIIEALRTGLASEAEISSIDGVMARFEDGWALARESVTEPVVTFRMEGQTTESLRRIVARVRHFVRELPEELV